MNSEYAGSGAAGGITFLAIDKMSKQEMQRSALLCFPTHSAYSNNIMKKLRFCLFL